MNDATKFLKLNKSHAVFAPIIDDYEVIDHQRLNELLVAEIRKWSEEEQGITRSNVSGWHSDGNVFKRVEPGLKEICSFFVEACRPMLERYMSKEKLKEKTLQLEGWVNVNPPHSYNQMHCHDRFDLSGVYFVKIPERSHTNSGALQFLNPSYRSGPYSDLFNAMNPQAFTVRPTPGKMLIFPSTMPHWVLPNDEDEDRISIAFNLRMK